MPLRRKERNEIFDLVQEAGLSPAEFSWGEANGRSRIIHVPTGEAHIFGRTHITRRRPVPAYVINMLYELVEGSWRAQRRAFRSWLEDLRDEITTPDAWAFLQSGEQASFFDATEAGTDNSPFSPDEREQIAAHLHQLRIGAIDRQSLSEAQLRALDSKIEDLLDASRRLGRKDWQTVFLGVMLTLVVTSVLTPETMQQLTEEFRRGVTGLFSQPPSLPPPPS